MPLPLVSVLTPTYCRSEFFPELIEMYKDQTYPRDRLEWIIYDDSPDNETSKIVRPLMELLNIKYIHRKEWMPLGEKRQVMFNYAKGDFLVNFDDDDYHYPDRIMYSVTKLLEHPEYDIAGSSILPIYYPKLARTFYFGPYGKNHATAGTWTFHKNLLKYCYFDMDCESAEESYFLHGFTIPMLQLPPDKIIVCQAHDDNTVDKYKLLLKYGINYDNC